jgi:signal transduction histidine kinase
MNVDKLLRRYFAENEQQPMIEVFDHDTIYDTYRNIVQLLNSYPDIEVTVLQALSYCFYEILDNVLTHSERKCGTVVTQYLTENNKIQVLVADDGIGIAASLRNNPEYADITEENAVRYCINDGVTDGKGMGFGLYSTSRLIKNVGITLEIHSGCNKLIYDGVNVNVVPTQEWQGTIIYFELHSDKDINPNDVVDNRTDCENQFNEEFCKEDELDKLW